MMMPLSIRCCHDANAVAKPNQFFILSKGDNAGKPSLEPWANSFLATACNEEMKDFYFWLIYGLYKAGSFKKLHRGSVIMFLSIVEIKKLVHESGQAIYPSWQEFKVILAKMEVLEKQKTKLAQLLKTTGSMQEFLVRSFLQQHGL